MMTKCVSQHENEVVEVFIRVRVQSLQRTRCERGRGQLPCGIRFRAKCHARHDLNGWMNIHEEYQEEEWCIPATEQVRSSDS